MKKSLTTKKIDPVRDPISLQVIDDCIRIYGPKMVIHGLIRHAERAEKTMSKSPAPEQADFWALMIRGYRKILQVGWNE